MPRPGSTVLKDPGAARTRALVTARHAPNVLAFQYAASGASIWTIYRSIPGDTCPRLALRHRDEKGLFGQAVDCGFITAPERFGSWGSAADLHAFVTRFFDL